MRWRLSMVLLFFICQGKAQEIHRYFERIRNNAAELTAFFAAMPKGGDLHHHFSGSVYAETFFQNALDSNFFFNPGTLEISREKPVGNDWITMQALRQSENYFDYRQRLLRKWSAMDYQPADYPSHRQFFESFDHFGPASEINYGKGLIELKTRAKAEHVAYIETMYRTIDCNQDLDGLEQNNKLLRDLQSKRSPEQISNTLDILYNKLIALNVSACAVSFNRQLEHLHDSLSIDDPNFTMRYQAFVLRFFDPVRIFRDLVVAFESANRSKLVVGVNIVAPEHHENAMQDYWLHMQMFRFLHNKYPSVKYSMHAGELTLGLVKPEDLTWHISSAIYDAGANRIGHGVDLAYEANAYSLLDYMSTKKIPVEINLFSNEFILKVKEDRHPVTLYQKHHVPIVISTDDEGVLRSNLVEQYVLLAKRYPGISYADIKQFVFNSIDYSFIEEPLLKQRLKTKLVADFRAFEKMISGTAGF